MRTMVWRSKDGTTMRESRRSRPFGVTGSSCLFERYGSSALDLSSRPFWTSWMMV